jgi:hypothetical protein
MERAEETCSDLSNFLEKIEPCIHPSVQKYGEMVGLWSDSLNTRLGSSCGPGIRCRVYLLST